MSDITKLLEAMDSSAGRSNEGSFEKLLPLVYDELRSIAKAKLAAERPDHTMQPTDLVHEAFLRMVGNANTAAFQNRQYFFAAAAEAMRRILVEAARRRMAQKRGANAQREWLDSLELPDEGKCQELIGVHESLDELTRVDTQSAELVKLRYFAGFTMEEIAEIQGISKRQAQLIWAFARTWLYREMRD